MLNHIRQLFAAPVFEDEDKTRAARLLNTILLAALLFGLASGAYYTATYYMEAMLGETELLHTWAEIGVAVVFCSVALALTRRGRVRAAGMMAAILAGTLFIYEAWSYGGVRSPEYARFLLVPVVVGLLMGKRATLITGGAMIVAGLALWYAQAINLLPEYDIFNYSLQDLWVTRSLDMVLTTTLLYLANQSIGESLERARRNERELTAANQALETSQAALEARTRDLERRTNYLEASAQVSHTASSTLNTDQLMRQVVDLIRERFNLYYVGLFLLGEANEWAVLRAGTGSAGRTLLAGGHQLPIGGNSAVGQSIATGRLCVAQEADTLRLATEQLPNTRCEAALPLRSRGRVIGALSVHSDSPGVFDDTLTAVLQSMADQVAVALDNARLLAESQEALTAERRAYGQASRDMWRQMMSAGLTPGFGYVGQQIVPIGDEQTPQMEAALRHEKSVVVAAQTGSALALPIKVRGQTIGVVDMQKKTPGSEWTAEEVTLVETLTEQLSVALESARLYQDTQQRASREQLAAQLTARMRETLDMDTVLKTAVLEIGQALGLAEVEVRMGTGEELGGENGHDEGQEVLS
jgi:GAF domain-containing protein